MALSGTAVRDDTGGPEKRRGITTRTSAVRIIARKSRFSIYRITSSGDWVKTARPEWVTASNAPNREPCTTCSTVTFERFNRIHGAAWMVSTRSWKKRREYNLISPNECDQHWPHLRITGNGQTGVAWPLEVPDEVPRIPARMRKNSCARRHPSIALILQEQSHGAESPEVSA